LAHNHTQKEFRQEVEKELTGKASEPHGIIYFKLYKSQIPVIEQAIETAVLMLGSALLRRSAVAFSELAANSAEL